MSCLFVLELCLYIYLATATNAEFMLSSSVVVKGEKHREFDYFKLALQWPPTACRQTQRCCSSNACCLNKSSELTEFTIHGLWPDYNDGTWPSCCSGSVFDEKEITVLHDTLEKYWPSLSCSSPSSCHGTKGSFWAHEWEKHGTCSYPVVQDEYDYFLTTLNVYLKYNVTRVLYEAGYVPSNTEKYPVGGIVSAIENAFHVTPSLQCFEGAIEELYLCFFKDFQPRNCAVGSIIQDRKYFEKSCPNYVSLPAFLFSGSSLAGSSLLCVVAIIISVFL